MSRPHQLESLLGYHLRRASIRIMSDLTDRLAELGLRTTEASVLVSLHAEPLITQSEIGRRLGIKRANMAPLIAGLIARDLIDRGQPTGRAHPLRLTPKGDELAQAARAQMDEHDAAFFGSLSPDDREKLRTTLATLWREGPREADAPPA